MKRPSSMPSEHVYHLAQTERLRRFCRESGVDFSAVMAGKVRVDLETILGPDGLIVPEAVDIELVQQRGYTPLSLAVPYPLD